MAARGRSYGQSNGWDDNDDYNDTVYDAQYADDDNTGGGVNLDHCRLYITNVPRDLNEDGLRSSFGKYGPLTEVFVSRDPQKKYALVRYETANQAKMAMMKMNKVEPLRLVINIAHKSRVTDKSNKQHRERSSGLRDRNGHRNQNQNHWDAEDTASYGSKGKGSKYLTSSLKENKSIKKRKESKPEKKPIVKP